MLTYWEEMVAGTFNIKIEVTDGAMTGYICAFEEQGSPHQSYYPVAAKCMSVYWESEEEALSAMEACRKQFPSCTLSIEQNKSI